MSLTDYSDMEQEIKETPDAVILERGAEVKARVIAVRSGIGDYGKWYQLTYDVPDQPLVKEFTDFFSDLIDAKKNGNEKQYIKAKRKFKNFADAFSLDYSKPFDFEKDTIGLKGWIIAGVKKSDEYGEQNTVSKYIAGPGEGAKAEPVDDIPF